MVSVLSTQPDIRRGSVQLSGRSVPDGSLVVTRTAARGYPEEIRGGVFDVDTGGFVRTDAEAPFGETLTYTVTDELTSRYVQSNRVLNPKAGTNTSNTATGTGRTLARETDVDLVPPRDAATSFRVPAYPGGATSRTRDDRLLASVTPSGLAAGRWFVSGQFRYNSPDLWLWQDVKNHGTWQAAKDVGTWETLAAQENPGADQPYASLWMALLGPAKTSAERRRNLVPNPVPASGTSWFSTAGTGGTATTSVPTTDGPTGGAFFRATWTVATTNAAGTGSTGAITCDGRGTASLPIPVTPGQVYSAAIYGRPSIAQRLDGRLQWYDASNTPLTTELSAAQVVGANTWARFSVTGTAPAGAAYARIAVGTPSGTGAVPFPIGATLDAAMAQLEQAATVGPFFAGSSAAGAYSTYTWAGAANASVSIETVLDYPEVVAAVQVLGVTMIGGGNWHTFQAWIDIPAGFPAGSRLAFMHGTVDREYSTIFWLTTLMVSPEAEMATGALTYLDGDTLPPDNPAAQVVPGYDWEDASGDATITWSGTPNNSMSIFNAPSVIRAWTTVDLGVPDTTIIKSEPVMLSDPISAQLSQWFTLISIGDLTNPARNNEFDVLGRRDRIVTSQLRGWETGQLTLLTYTRAQEQQAERMFGMGRILLLRNPNPDYPENAWYLSVGDVARARLGRDHRRPERLWTVPFTRVQRPVGLIEAAVSTTWLDVRESGTWDQVKRGNTDWLDVAVSE